MIAKSTFCNGYVVCCRSHSDGSLVAVKCIDVDMCPSPSLALLQREAALSRTISHPNISVHSSVWLTKRRLCMSSPLMEYGSCADIMSRHFHYGLPEDVISLIIYEILKALVYLHDMNMIHRGIKCSHILISKNGDVKLSGFRNAIELTKNGYRVEKVHDFPKHDSSLLPWLSPEILQQDMQGYCAKSDIYSLGITTCELANGHAPFTDMPGTQMLLEKLHGTIPFLLDETTVAPPSDNESESEAPTVNGVTRLSMIKAARSRKFSPMLHKFATDCLEREPGSRMSAEELMKHSFFKKIKGRSNLEILQPIFDKLEPLGGKNSVVGDMEETVSALSNMNLDDWDFSGS